MLNLKEFISAIDQIAEEKGISTAQVTEVIEQALAAAYKRDYGERGQNIKAILDPKTGDVKFFQVFYIVTPDMLLSEEEIKALEEERAQKESEAIQDPEEKDAEEKNKRKTTDQEEEEESLGEGEERKIRFNEKRHILLEDAKKKDENIEVGGEVLLPLDTKEDFGRIAAQTAKQVIIQRIREAERNAVFEAFKEKEGEIVSGTVQRVERGVVHLDLGRTTGVLFPEEQIPYERYRQGQRVRLFVVRVEKESRGPVIVLSRRHPRIIAKLFELEVPEVANNIVEIKAIAREAGSRSKVAVASNEEGIDPVGACVGQRGVRVSAVINELGGENIDIIAWDMDPGIFIANALSPAKVLDVDLEEETRTATVQVREDQLSLAIGKRGQNVRLAAKLTGWKIDVQGAEKVLAQEGVSEEDYKAQVAEAAEAEPDFVEEDVEGIEDMEDAEDEIQGGAEGTEGGVEEEK